MNTGKRIKMLREKYNLTQISLSASMGIPQSTLVGYEKRYDNNTETIEKVCTALKISLVDFYKEDTLNNEISETKEQKKEEETVREIKEAFKVNPDTLITLCRAQKVLPEDVMKNIKDYAAFEMEKFLNKKK